MTERARSYAETKAGKPYVWGGSDRKGMTATASWEPSARQ